MPFTNFYDFMDAVFRLVAHNHTIFIFLGVLFAVFASGLVQTLLLRSWFSKTFKAAGGIIERLSPNGDHGSFYENYDEIDKEITEKSEVSDVWREFTESTFRDEPYQQICLSARPQTYFQKHIVASSRMNLKQLQAYPNYLIGLGLFFTFLGLASALHIAQADLALKGGESQQALFTLLKVASLKFISSMVAILLSIGLSFFQRAAFSSSQKSIANFCSLLEERTEFVPSVKMLSRSLHEHREQTKFQADMALNISVKLGEILAKSLPESVAEALKPLAEEIRGLAKQFNGSNENALQQVLQDFLGQLRKSTGQDMDALVESVRTVNQSLGALVENLRGFSTNFGQDTQSSTEKLTECMRLLVENFQPVQAGIGQFGSTLQKLESVAMQIQEAGGSISGAASVNRDMSRNLVDSLGGISDQIAPLQTALVKLNEGMNTVATTAQSIEQVSANMSTASQDLRASAGEIGSSQRLLAEKLQNFGQVADSINSTVTTLKVASQHVGDALEPFKAASMGINETASAIKETEKRIQAAQDNLLKTQVDVQTAIEKIPEILSKYEERFGKVDADMARAFEKLAEGSGHFQESIKEFVEKLDTSFSKAINGLSGAVQEMSDEREEFYSEERRQ
jgi:methyl-accepting chemotaxis protein